MSKPQDFPNYPHRAQNQGHGHVFIRPDGNRLRCGGPGGCLTCAEDALAAAELWMQAIAANGGSEDEALAAKSLAATGKALIGQANSDWQRAAQSQSFGESADSKGLLQFPDSTWSPK